MKIQSAWHFFFSPSWSDFETPRDPSWTETGVLQHFLLVHSISSAMCVFLCVLWGSSSMWIFSQVLFWLCLFPLRPFCQRLDNGCNHFRLGINTVGSLQDESEEREGRDPAGDQRAHSTGALYHLCSLYGNRWGAAVGGVGWSGGRTGACRQ